MKIYISGGAPDPTPSTHQFTLKRSQRASAGKALILEQSKTINVVFSILQWRKASPATRDGSQLTHIYLQPLQNTKALAYNTSN